MLCISLGAVASSCSTDAGTLALARGRRQDLLTPRYSHILTSSLLYEPLFPFVISCPFQPPVNGVPKIKWNLGPSPPERAENEVDRRQSHQHVVAKKKPVEEKHDEANRNNTENQTRDEREEKEQYSRPKRDSRLRSRELAASALGTYAGAPRINVQPRTEFDIITSTAKIAE